MFEININPIAFEFGPIKVGWYGIAIAIGIIVLIWWTLRALKRSNGQITRDHIMNAAIVGIPSGIIFSRVLHVIDRWSYFMEHPAEIVGGQGLTIYGAVLGAALGIWVYSRFAKFNYALLVDLVAPGIILAQMIGRVGCLFNGCCYGDQTDTWCSIVYSDPHTFGPIGIPVYPTQVFEIFALAAMFGIVTVLRNRVKPAGMIFMLYMAMYGAWRIGIGFLRVGSSFALGLEQAQVIGIIVLLVTVPPMVMKMRWIKKESAGHE